MSTRLTLKQRIVIAACMEVYQSATYLRRSKFSLANMSVFLNQQNRQTKNKPYVLTFFNSPCIIKHNFMMPKIAYVALKSLPPRSLHETHDGIFDGMKLINIYVG
jgi:hypothetical protein